MYLKGGLPKGSAREIEAVSQAFGALVERLSQARRQLAEAIERERLKDAQTVLVLEDKLKSSLQAAAVAHEINLPLSTLLLNSKLLLHQQEAPLPTNLNEHLQAIASNADEVVTTIEKMRTLLRNVQTHQRRLNLAYVARSALLYAGPSLKAAGITVQREGLETSLAVLGDAAQIQIAVVNLLRNALEALETAGPFRSHPRHHCGAAAKRRRRGGAQRGRQRPGVPGTANSIKPHWKRARPMAAAWACLWCRPPWKTIAAPWPLAAPAWAAPKCD